MDFSVSGECRPSRLCVRPGRRDRTRVPLSGLESFPWSRTSRPCNSCSSRFRSRPPRRNSTPSKAGRHGHIAFPQTACRTRSTVSETSRTPRGGRSRGHRRTLFVRRSEMASSTSATPMYVCGRGRSILLSSQLIILRLHDRRGLPRRLRVPEHLRRAP